MEHREQGRRKGKGEGGRGREEGGVFCHQRYKQLPLNSGGWAASPSCKYQWWQKKESKTKWKRGGKKKKSFLALGSTWAPTRQLFKTTLSPKIFGHQFSNKGLFDKKRKPTNPNSKTTPQVSKTYSAYAMHLHASTLKKVEKKSLCSSTKAKELSDKFFLLRQKTWVSLWLCSFAPLLPGDCRPKKIRYSVSGTLCSCVAVVFLQAPACTLVVLVPTSDRKGTSNTWI